MENGTEGVRETRPLFQLYVLQSGHYTTTRSLPQPTLRNFPGDGFGGPHFPLSAFPVAIPDECKKQ